jgi:hypothetical protein
MDDRAVVRMVTGRNRSCYRCPAPSAFRSYLRLHLGITDLDAYIEMLDRENRDGEDSLLATVSTKTLRQKGLQGFFIKALSSGLQMNGTALGALPPGVEYFVHTPEILNISNSALVVGVENPECFVKIDRLAHLFPQEELVCVLRYYGNSSVEWLQTIVNPYLHFGDFDPAGISIYCSEYLRRLGEQRCRFWVPNNIEKLMEAHGLAELFEQQKHLWPPKTAFQQRELKDLVNLISKHGKGLEQEQLF